METLERNLERILLKSTSYMDVRSENFYHGLILGMLCYLDDHYYVKSNVESGLGRYDVLIEPKKKAMEQIENKKYDIELKERGIKDITFVGIAFYNKLVKASYK